MHIVNPDLPVRSSKKLQCQKNKTMHRFFNGTGTRNACEKMDIVINGKILFTEY